MLNVAFDPEGAHKTGGAQHTLFRNVAIKIAADKCNWLNEVILFLSARKLYSYARVEDVGPRWTGSANWSNQRKHVLISLFPCFVGSHYTSQYIRVHIQGPSKIPR